jgi:hypothetical protein
MTTPAMSSIFEDDSVFDCFEAAHSHDPRVADDLKVEVLDWFDGKKGTRFV